MAGSRLVAKAAVAAAMDCRRRGSMRQEAAPSAPGNVGRFADPPASLCQVAAQAQILEESFGSVMND